MPLLAVKLNNAAADLAILRREVTRLQRELLHCFHRRLKFVDALIAVGIGGLLALEAHLTLLVKPLTRMTFWPDCSAPGIKLMKANGLRTYPPAMTPKFSGRLLMRSPVMLWLCSALSVRSSGASAQPYGLIGGTDLQDDIDASGERDLDRDPFWTDWLKPGADTVSS